MTEKQRAPGTAYDSGKHVQLLTPLEFPFTGGSPFTGVPNEQIYRIPPVGPLRRHIGRIPMSLLNEHMLEHAGLENKTRDQFREEFEQHISRRFFGRRGPLAILSVDRERSGVYLNLSYFHMDMFANAEELVAQGLQPLLYLNPINPVTGEAFNTWELRLARQEGDELILETNPNVLRNLQLDMSQTAFYPILSHVKLQPYQEGESFRLLRFI